jgi:pectin methylesterase-like acyl-CoA thioesterase
VLRVPDDHATIRAAVDAAAPGGLVLIAPGTYRESVRVTTARIVLRGLDRDGVVLDGAFTLGDGTSSPPTGSRSRT